MTENPATDAPAGSPPQPADVQAPEVQAQPAHAPAPAAASPRHSHAPWPLRRQLVIVVVALLALVSIVIGLVSVAILRAGLQDELDGQLRSAAERSHGVVDHGDRGGVIEEPSAATILNGPAQASGTLALVFDGSTISYGYLDESGAVQGLTAQQVQLLAEHTTASTPVTIDLGGDVGRYRVLGEVTRSGTAYLIGLPLANVDDTATRLALIIALVSLVGVLAVAALAAWIVRLALRPLQRVTETAARVAELPLDRGEVSLVDRVPEQDTDPRTEVGRVGSALNRMLDHVDLALETRQASENKVRRFVADASHELRTPLASIRGYSELTRRTGQDLPEDAAHALRRIESESVRMTGLVEDLLLLARLDEGRELEREPVDLTALLIDTVADAHVAGPRHIWHLELPDEPVQVAGDQGRLHQVVANLLANARIHTPAGTTVTVGLATLDDDDGDGGDERAVITVTDDGPGIPEGLQATLFERFARGDSSRSRETGSTGLGLAIARAVVTAHQGDITVESRPGFTRFTVTLPA